MKRLLIIADVPEWCFARRAEALQRNAPPGWDVTIEYYGGQKRTELAYEAHDIVFLIAPMIAGEVRQIFNTSKIKIPLVVSYNSGPGRNGYSLPEILVAADFVIVNNYMSYIQGRFGARKYNACNISNGVDCNLFRSIVPWHDRPKKCLWVGSKNKADDGDDIKGWNRTLRPLQMILKPRFGYDPDFRIIEPGGGMTDAEMVAYYNSGRVLFCASHSEGTPNICLEAAACGTAIVTTPVGNMPELVRHKENGFIVRARVGVKPGLLEFLENIEADMGGWGPAAERMLYAIQKWDWSIRARWFYALFSAILERGAENVEPFSYLSRPPEMVGV